MSTHVCPAGKAGKRTTINDPSPGAKLRAGRPGRARTSLAEEGELLVAVLGVPAVQPPLVHVFDLEALQLGAEDVVLAGRRLPQVGETLRGQEHLHGA